MVLVLIKLKNVSSARKGTSEEIKPSTDKSGKDTLDILPQTRVFDVHG